MAARFPDRLKGLVELALDLHWAWSHNGDALWAEVDAEGWRRTQNPFVILRGLTQQRLEALNGDTGFIGRLDSVLEARRQYLQRQSWWQDDKAAGGLRGVAYFSMEFGLCEALPLYAGGLGILAGDLLKSSSDLGVPITGIGLMYRQGYFRQRLDPDGWQHALYVHNDPADLPIAPVFAPDGALLTITINLPGRDLRLRAWRTQVGRVALYLLDSNDPWNQASDRGITDRLYGGGREERLMQEIVLGIGGWRLVEALGLDIDICHLNEGHAAFAALERARAYSQRSGLSFREALWATRAGNVFTTHTAVPAGFDLFPLPMLEPYLRTFVAAANISSDEIRRYAQDGDRDAVNMGYLAARTCGVISAVSQRHGLVSQEIFSSIFPRWPRAEIPIIHVTNGVHMPYWDSAAADALWTQACGRDRWLVPTEPHESSIACLPDADLWQMRGAGRVELVRYARERLVQQQAQHDGYGAADPSATLDPNALTLGFARRFADYKRPDLLLRQAERLVRLLNHERRPVQLIIAGKAHPDDERGKRLLQAWMQFAARPDVAGRVVMLEDYDLALAQQLVQGVDLWINTPRRPWEACGTSGMKVLVNGGLNLSSLDGWWEEAYDPAVGWAFGTRPAPDAQRDDVDAQELIEVLETEVLPLFFERDEHGIPRGWVARMRASMAALAPRFSANRMLRDYVTHLYQPASAALARRLSDDARVSRDLAAWNIQVRDGWDHIHLGSLSVSTGQASSLLRLPVYFGDITAEQVQVQLYADASDRRPAACCEPMTRREAIPGSLNGYWYECALPADQPAADYTPRVVPFHPEAAVPQELALIRWLDVNGPAN